MNKKDRAKLEEIWNNLSIAKDELEELRSDLSDRASNCEEKFPARAEALESEESELGYAVDNLEFAMENIDNAKGD